MRFSFFVSVLVCGACGPSIPHPVAKPAGCAIQLFWGADTPPGITDSDQYWYFRDAQVDCEKDVPDAVCQRRLQDRACAVGADLLYVVEKAPSDVVKDGTRFFGKPALRR